MQEQIDKGFANPSWRLHFHSATITHLQALNSDHRPLLLNLKNVQNTLPSISILNQCGSPIHKLLQSSTMSGTRLHLY